MPEMQVPRKLLPFITTPKRFKIALGGRGGAKSVSFAKMLAMKAQTENAKILCLRELHNSIDDSVHPLLVEQIDGMQLSGFGHTKTEISVNGETAFKFKGLAHNTDAVKSAHGFKYAWVEEAQSISQESIEKLTPTLREEGSEVWFSMNPGSSTDPMSKRFLEPFMDHLQRDGYYEDDQHLIVWINYDDNPWFPQVLEDERVWDEQHLPASVYRHKWLGDYLDEIENSIIKAEWFDACIDAHLVLGWKPRGAKFVSFDPSDRGDDAKGLAYRHGNVFLDVTESMNGDINESCDWATDYALSVKADYFNWDCDGMGVGLRRQVSDSLRNARIEVQEYRGSAGVAQPKQRYEGAHTFPGSKPKTNEETFDNRRAQRSWGFRDMVYNTYKAVTEGEYKDPSELVSFSSSIKYMNKFRSEACRVPLHPRPKRGLIQLMSKDEMLRLYKIQSPNMFDAAVATTDVDTIKVINRQRVNIPSIKARRMSR